MKKLICWLLTLAICFGLAACGTPAPAGTTAPGTEPSVPETTAPAVEPDNELADAVAYLKNIYKEAAETTASDFQRVGTVMVGQNAYEVVWSADVEGVKFTKDETGMVTVDVIEDSETDIPYVLTATLTGTDGTTQTLSWNHVMPASLAGNTGKIIELAYALEDGQSLDTVVTLTGTISSVDTAWSEDYQNITVTIKVAGYEDYPIQCYRLKGEGAKDLAYGDVITVTGTIKNYKGIIEFDAGCNLDSVVKGSGEGPESPIDYDIIVQEAMALKPGQSLPYTATLTGRVEAINYSYSEKYGDMSITIEVRGEDIYCYRLTSPRKDWLKQVGEGDWVTVMGKIKNYNGTVEFDSATMIAYTDYYKVEGPEDPLEHIDAAYALKPNKSLEYTSTLTGVITEIDTEWSDYYGNISVVMEVPGREDKPILCYRLTGEGAEGLAVGDTITVTGTLMKFLYDGDDESEAVVEFKAGCELDEVVKGETPVEPSEPVEPETPVTTPDYVTAPAAGTAYKLGLNQTNKESVYYFTGAMSGYYGASEDNWDDGVDVYLEEVSGGYHLYFTDADGVKQYISLVKSGTYYNFVFDTEAACVFTFDEEKDALCTDLEGEVCYMGTYGNYVTFGVLRTSKLSETDYIARLYTSAGSSETPEDDTTTDPTEPEETTPEETTPETTVPFVKPTTPEEIVNAAYELEAGETLEEGPYTLTGVITSFKYTYDPAYTTIACWIQVGDMDDKLIQCYRLSGEGIDVIDVGDTITVTGPITNYNGTIEFNGCTLDSYVLAGGDDDTTDPTVPEETTPETTEPEETTPETTEPEETTPETTVPEETTPETTVPEETTPETTVPEEPTATLMTAAPESGDVVVIYNAASTVVLSDTASGSKLSGITATAADDEITLADGMAELTVTKDGDYYIFSVGGKYLTSGLTGSSLTLADELTNCARWILEEADGGWYIKNARAAYNGKTQYIEYYRSFTTYSFNSGGDAYVLQLYFVEAGTPVTIPAFEKPETSAEIVAAAYDLIADTTLAEGPYTLTGEITSVDTAYSSTYKNITVTINVEDKSIQCFRLTGEDLEAVAGLGIGDKITVTGELTNYNNTSIQFAKDCTLGEVVKSQVTLPTATLLTSAPVAGDVVVICNGSNAMTATASGTKLAGEAATIAENVLTVTENLAQLTVSKEGDYYIFSCGGKYLASTGTGNNLVLQDALDEYAKWTLESAGENVWYITNAGANYNGNYNQTIEYYNGFTTYGKKTTAIYHMQLFKMD